MIAVLTSTDSGNDTIFISDSLVQGENNSQYMRVQTYDDTLLVFARAKASDIADQYLEIHMDKIKNALEIAMQKPPISLMDAFNHSTPLVWLEDTLQQVSQS